MIAYIDSSVLLWAVLGEKGILRELPRIKRAISSEFIRLECLRTLDRARLQLRLPDQEIALRRTELLRRLEAYDLIRVSEQVLERASLPLPTVVGSLDAIHLSSALTVRAPLPGLLFATHDERLAEAARACDLAVIGC